MKITIGIKALNEEKHIAASIESALKAVEPFDGEVVLADSGSTDRTIEIASRYPIRIVQLADPGERSCGTGAQLAFQHAQGEFFYLLDGDMIIEPDFLPVAIDFLESHPQVAAVGGLVCEMNTEGNEFAIRATTVAKDRNWLPGIVDRLDCGGLYRTDVLRQLGYFADRNLHAFEEFETAARLQSKGWLLARIDAPAVQHFGHTIDSYKLIWKRIRSGYSGAVGEVLRAAIGNHHAKTVLRKMSHIRFGVIVWCWWLALIGAALLGQVYAFAAIFVLPVLFLAWRRGSLNLGLYSFCTWNVSALGLITGFFRRRKPPHQAIASVTLASANAGPADSKAGHASAGH